MMPIMVWLFLPFQTACCLWERALYSKGRLKKCVSALFRRPAVSGGDTAAGWAGKCCVLPAVTGFQTAFGFMITMCRSASSIGTDSLSTFTISTFSGTCSSSS